MKYTKIIAAGLAAGASADDWSSWSDSVKTDVPCPKKVTQTVTTTADCAEVTSEIYKTTITVEAPKTRTVTVYADGKTAKQFWEDWTYNPAPAPPTSLPHSCVPKVVTETETAWVKKAGSTTTITKSTLFVGAGDCAATTITVTETGSAPTPAWQSWGSGSSEGSDESGYSGGDGYSGGSDSGDSSGGSGGGYGSDDDQGSDGGYGDDSGSNGYSGGSDNGDDVDNWNNGEGPRYTVAPGGHRIPAGETVIATDRWKFPLAPTHTKSYSPPVYTQKPDGTYGGNSGWDEWNNWPGDGDGGNGGNDPGKGPGKNGTHSGAPSYPGWNATAGSPGSNVTKPILPLKSNGYTNSAGSRDKWCDGKSIESNYYESYFSGKTCTFDLTISRMQLALDGEKRDVMAINGQYPGPLIECNWGDMVRVTVHNQLGNNGTSIHWHGFRQVGTNSQDGVPGITECPIAPGSSATYEFHACSYGTSWYHSHWMSQYGDGIFGPIVIHGPTTAEYDEDMGVVQLSDLFNRTAAQQMAIVAATGPKNAANCLINGKNVKFDLSSGQHTLWSVEKGKKYLFRIINSGAQNMYSVSLDNHQMTVIAGDFVPIHPYTTEWLNIGIGQRYDVVIEMNQPVDSYFLRAVTQVGCGGGTDNTGLGNANAIVAYKGVQTTPYLLPTSTTNKTIADFATCDDEPLASLVPYLKMGAGTSSAFASSASTLPVDAPALVQTSDDGAVFKWFLNNGNLNINFTQPTLKSLDEKVSLNSTLFSNPIILKGPQQWYYFVIQNNFFANHPMHLHGHDFSLLGQGSGAFDVTTMLNTLNFNNPMRRDTAMLKGAERGPGGPPPGGNGGGNGGAGAGTGNGAGAGTGTGTGNGAGTSNTNTNGGASPNSKRQAGGPGGGGGPPPSSPQGYTVIGFETDNPGAWLMHCHIIWHVDEGLALQWIERPDEITTKKYVSTTFEDQCKAYTNYETEHPEGKKFSAQSGLKRRAWYDDVMKQLSDSFQPTSPARRSDSHAAKHYLDSVRQKRSFGDGHRPRHFGRK